MNQQPIILCVDDEPRNLALLEAVLSPCGYQTLLAPNGETALAMLHSERIDLVLLDVMMPGLGGFEVCRRIKADPATSAIPVIFVTSLGDFAVETKGLALGAADYLTKPIVSNVLLARVRTHLDLKAHRDRLEELAETRARQLVHAERLATIGTLTAGIIHEINSPLTFVLGFSGTLLEDMKNLADLVSSPAADEAELLAACRHFIKEDLELAGRVAEGAKRIHVIMESMRKFSRRGQLEKAQVSLVGCIENALVLCHNVLKYRVTVHKEFAPDLPPILANGQQVEQVFVNLFKNAADAMAEQKMGTLAISLGLVDGFIRCIIEDNGPGIDPGQLETVWEPFFTTKDAESGTGLGLSVSRGIIEEHQGRIWVENREPWVSGARFVVELPVIADVKEEGMGGETTA